MRIIIFTDIEGVSGVTSFEDQAASTGKYYEQAKKLLTAEVNSAVDGIVEAGATDILVVDGHGAGGICFEDLHPAAKLLHGKPLPLCHIYAELSAEYDAAMIIGQHAKCGIENGNLNHTQSQVVIEYYKLNGKEIGEIAQLALGCGVYDIPVIFLSGDKAACDEAKEIIPGITTAIVKYGLTRTAAISLSTHEARRRIYENAKESLKKQKTQPTNPVKWPGPYVMEIRYLFTDTADSTSMNPLYERIDAKTVRLQSDDLLKILDA